MGNPESWQRWAHKTQDEDKQSKKKPQKYNTEN